jgi:hypothetical protein
MIASAIAAESPVCRATFTPRSRSSARASGTPGNGTGGSSPYAPTRRSVKLGEHLVDDGFGRVGLQSGQQLGGGRCADGGGDRLVENAIDEAGLVDGRACHVQCG